VFYDQFGIFLMFIYGTYHVFAHLMNVYTTICISSVVCNEITMADKLLIKIFVSKDLIWQVLESSTDVFLLNCVMYTFPRNDKIIMPKIPFGKLRNVVTHFLESISKLTFPGKAFKF